MDGLSLHKSRCRHQSASQKSEETEAEEKKGRASDNRKAIAAEHRRITDHQNELEVELLHLSLKSPVLVTAEIDSSIVVSNCHTSFKLVRGHLNVTRLL